ncbi:MAG: class I SAM-dependent methyltransferase [Candidatus Micrarchaeia archaeon]
MKCLIVNKENAEKAKKYLTKHSLLNSNYKVFGRKSFIYFPISQDSSKLHKFGKIGNASFEKSIVKLNFKKELDALLSDEKEHVARGYDLLGNIAIIEAEPKLAKKVARLILLMNKNIETVLRKAGAVEGIYRKRQYKYVLGKRNFVAHYKENGCIFEFDVRKVFFSTRLAYERHRISEQVKSGEHVLVMFAGVGPFAIEIAKAVPSSKVVAVELNKAGYQYMLKNIKLNKVNNVTPLLGDASKLPLKFKNFADRIVMPLPKDSYHFLDAAYSYASKKTVIHYYTFTERSQNFDEAAKNIKNFFKGYKAGVKINKIRLVRPYSSKLVEVVIDFTLEKQ